MWTRKNFCLDNIWDSHFSFWELRGIPPAFQENVFTPASGNRCEGAEGGGRAESLDGGRDCRD